MNIHFDKKLIQSIDFAIKEYGSGEFTSPTRSTVPLLSWLKNEQPALLNLLEELGLPADSNLHLEYKVTSGKGSGKASHTDLMVISGGSAIAIEVKWTEPRYETISDWLAKGSNPQNRSDVLTGWLDLLQRHAKHALYLEDFKDAVYQTVHRAASACAACDSNPKMAYLLFKPSPSPHTADANTIRGDLEHLWQLLGSPTSLPFYLIEVNMNPTTAFEAIASLEKGTDDTIQRVTGALLGSKPLFEFEKYLLTEIGDDSHEGDRS